VRVVADTGPLVAVSNSRDPAHRLANVIAEALGRQLVVPEPVVVEVDHLVRARVSSEAANRFLQALARREHTVRFSSQAVLERAVEIDAQFQDLDLGYTDAVVMAIAERERLPILTFDFTHFRATRPAHGFWQLVVDEQRYREETS